MKTKTNRTKWAAGILSTLVAVAFIPGGIMKTTNNPMVVEGFGHTGIPVEAITILGIVELACLALYLIPRTAILGTLLLTGYLGGATLANLINRSDFIHVLVVGLVVWAGAWVRVPAFRALVPIRKTKKAAQETDANPEGLPYAVATR